MSFFHKSKGPEMNWDDQASILKTFPSSTRALSGTTKGYCYIMNGKVCLITCENRLYLAAPPGAALRARGNQAVTDNFGKDSDSALNFYTNSLSAV